MIRTIIIWITKMILKCFGGNSICVLTSRSNGMTVCCLITLCAVDLTMRRIVISPNHTIVVVWTKIMSCLTCWSQKIQILFIFRAMWEMTAHVLWYVRLEAHTLFIERMLYFPISHLNEYRLHIHRPSRACGSGRETRRGADALEISHDSCIRF